MTLRTPRRRISPRTKRRYRAIKGFFKRALGTISQPDFKTNSTIAVSVADLKNTIVSIEDQLNRVSKHCQELACLESSFRKEAKKLSKEKQDRTPEECMVNTETQILYQNSDSRVRTSDDSEIPNTAYIYHDTRKNMTSPDRRNESKSKHRRNFDYNDRQHIKTRYFKNNHNSLIGHQSTSCIDDPGDRYDTKADCSRQNRSYHKRECLEPNVLRDLKDKTKTNTEIDPPEQYHDRQRRKKRKPKNIDQKYIEDIIKRQYKPIKLYGRRESDFSQFSAPVCRDQEFIIKEELHESSDLCSCCFERGTRHCDGHINKRRYSDFSDIRSVCDTRLYSSNRRSRRIHTRGKINDYNDSAYYDIVPVKEKSSPKSRRKIIADNLKAPPQHYREVLPSPRTQKPQLNLKPNKIYEECENEYGNKRHHRSRSRQNYEEVKSGDISDHTHEVVSNSQLNPKCKVNMQKQKLREDVGTMSSLANDQIDEPSNDTTLNTQTSDTSDKTLSEIKNILQNFLQEIKKESSNGGKSNTTNKADIRQSNDKLNSNLTQKSRHSFNNCQCNIPPYMPPFTNPCCYPILPICPMNCMQNGYVVPSPSYCAICAKNSKEPDYLPSSNKNKESGEDFSSKETHELIRQIYKFVSQSPNMSVMKETRSENRTSSSKNRQSNFEKKIMASRSVGGNSKVSKQDAYVGTPTTKYVSKSCEALRTPLDSDTFYSNASYSDTILEKLSLQPKQSSAESESSSEDTEKKIKKSKFKKIFKNLALWKKKKKDVIEELSESESTTEATVRPRPPPFKQNIMNYNVHGQEFYHPYAMSHNFLPPGFTHGHEYNPYIFEPSIYHYPNRHPHLGYPHSSKARVVHHSICNPHCSQPQVPVCLKEIEVKSTGTQSEQKYSIFNKFAQKKLKPQYSEPPSQRNTKPKITEKPGKFSWKSFQEQAKNVQGQSKQVPNTWESFGWKTQKELAQRDMNIRNGMIKKLFYKKNPFSPRNLIVRTLLGKDPSSFGNPPKLFKPKMFI